MKKYISVLLAVFVFVLGMMTKDVFAAPDMGNLANEVGEMVGKQVAESLLLDVSKPAESLEEALKIEGVNNLKLVEKGESSKVTGELAAGQKIRLHYYVNKYPLSQVNEKRRVNGENPIEYYNWNSTISLTAKNIKNQVIREIKKSYKNTRDNILEYQAAKDVTRIEIKISGSFVGQVKGHEKPSTGTENFDPIIILTVNKKLKPVAIAPAKASKDKNPPAKKTDGKQTAKKTDDDSGGLGTAGKVGIGLAAAGAIGFGVTHLGGGAGAGSGPAGAAETETPPAPPEPESFVFTDPATGAQSLYEKDPETGQWVNQQTGGIADIDDLDRFAKQRQADADWTRGQMEKLSNRDTDLDRAWREQDAKTDAELQRKFEEIDRQGARDRVAIKSGTYGMSDAERTKYLTERQERLQKNSEAANQSAKNWDRITKTAEVVEKAADIAVDGLAVVTAPVGGTLVADVYSGAKNIAGSTSEAIAKGESIVGGITKGVAKGAADIVQNHAGGKWVKKLGTYAGSETLKEVIVAAVDGENVVDAAKKGLVNGTFKYAVSEIGDNISDGVSKQNENLMKQHYNKIKNVWSKDVSQKSVNALQSMNFQKYFGKETTRELAQGFGQSLTKEVGSVTYDTAVEGKSVTESLFDDKW